MGRFLGSAVAMAMLVLVGCAPKMTVSSHVQYGTDFAKFKTYAWGAPDALPAGDARLEKDPFFRDHLEGAVERRFAARGLKLVANKDADLLVHYHAAINRKMDVNTFDTQSGYCADDGCISNAVEFEAGTIVLDLIDARTKRLLWRGWAQTGAEDMLKDRDKMASRVEEAAVRMVDNLPNAGFVAAARPGPGTGARVNAFAEPDVNFSRFASYSLESPKDFATGDPRLDNNALFEARLQKAITKALDGRGLKAAKGRPDVLIHYHASVRQEVDMNAVDQRMGYDVITQRMTPRTPAVTAGNPNTTSAQDRRPYVFEAGTLTIDVIDARTKRLVWRGWTERSLDGAIDDQAWLDGQVDEAVARILEKLPRKS